MSTVFYVYTSIANCSASSYRAQRSKGRGLYIHKFFFLPVTAAFYARARAHVTCVPAYRPSASTHKKTT
jgi:hypothetical protein